MNMNESDVVENAASDDSDNIVNPVIHLRSRDKERTAWIWV
jgi:hypothetical protein